MKTHIVSYSGGLASFYEAKLTIEKYGKENVLLVFCDTSSEDSDLYRFLNDTEKYLGVEIVRLKDGRDIWECAFQDNFLYNSRIANCTVYLKMRLFRNFINQFNADDIVIHLGFDFTEQHRFEKSKLKYAPIEIESIIMETNLTKATMIYDIEKNIGVKLPLLYRLGFAHNNCGGFCFKAGIGHFRQLYEKLPDRFDFHMNKEQELINKIGQNVSILKRVRNGETINITLKDLKNEWESNQQLSFDEMYDIGGCGCFIE